MQLYPMFTSKFEHEVQTHFGQLGLIRHSHQQIPKGFNRISLIDETQNMVSQLTKLYQHIETLTKVSAHATRSPSNLMRVTVEANLATS